MITRDRRTLPLRMAYQCAPLLAGMKESNLLIIESRLLIYVRDLLENTRIEMTCLYHNKEKVTLLLYERTKLKEHLDKREERLFLEERGYQDLRMEAMLCKLAERLADYWAGRAQFPHELGIFLAYPVHDVQGFIDHEGRNYLCSGYWKVYKNVKEAEMIFELYEQARILVTSHVRNGGGLDRFLSPDTETGQKKGDIYYEYSNYRRTRPYGLSV